MKKAYKYYAGITSQIPFCSTPLRLDSYNSCQYGCEYCFARTRQGYGRTSDLQIANPTSLERRLDRVFSGQITSALDEFISNRIPFQLGGMNDPFSPIELKEKVSLQYLKILKRYNYPVMISTKSTMIANDDYLNVLYDSNTYVRFSMTIIDSQLKPLIEKSAKIEHFLIASKKLSQINIPVAFRFQPIIPFFENHADTILDLAKDANVKHISAEYLKVSIDSNKKFGINLKKLLPLPPVSFYKSLNASLYGRDYILPLSYRQNKLIEIAVKAKLNKITFGFADNDLLIHSDGNACCNASNLYLKNANFFNANIVSIAKQKKYGERIYFDEFMSCWLPQNSISTYLNSKARLNKQMMQNNDSEWINYLKKSWLGEYGIYKPSFFDGIVESTQKDKQGLPIYLRCESEFENLYNSKLKIISKN